MDRPKGSWVIKIILFQTDSWVNHRAQRRLYVYGITMPVLWCWSLLYPRLRTWKLATKSLPSNPPASFSNPTFLTPFIRVSGPILLPNQNPLGCVVSLIRSAVSWRKQACGYYFPFKEAALEFRSTVRMNQPFCLHTCIKFIPLYHSFLEGIFLPCYTCKTTSSFLWQAWIHD